MGRVYRATGRRRRRSSRSRSCEAELARDVVFRRASSARRARRPARAAPARGAGARRRASTRASPTWPRSSSPAARSRTRSSGETKLDLDETVDICTADRRGARRAARRGPHPPRRQAGQHPARRRRARRTSPTSGWPRTATPACSRRPGQALGSMDYMAPEQIRGEEVDRAVGRVRARLRDVRVPVAASRRSPIARACASCGRICRTTRPTRPPRPRRRAADVGWAITRALEKEPEKRPPTATAYAQMVRIAALGMN